MTDLSVDEVMAFHKVLERIREVCPTAVITLDEFGGFIDGIPFTLIGPVDNIVGDEDHKEITASCLRDINEILTILSQKSQLTKK